MNICLTDTSLLMSETDTERNESVYVCATYTDLPFLA